MSVRLIRRFASLSFTTNHKPRTPSSPALFFSSTPQEHSIRTTDKLNRNVFSHEIVSRTSLAVSNSENPENHHPVVSFLKESGFSDTLLEKIVKSRPKFLSSNLELTIKPKIKIFQELGLSPDQIALVISAFPPILSIISQHNIKRSLVALKKVFGSNFDDPGVLKNFGWCVKYDLEKTLVPNVELLESCGFDSSKIMKGFCNYPRFLMLGPENFKESVRRVDEMGFPRESGIFIYVLRTVGSMTIESWQQKWDLFRGLGFSDGDILSLIRRAPNVFTMSVKNIKDTAGFLLASGLYDRSFISRQPNILNFSLDRKLRPRLQVLEILDRKKILKFKPSKEVFLISDEKFFDKYVSPHLDQVKELSFQVNQVTPSKCL